MEAGWSEKKGRSSLVFRSPLPWRTGALASQWSSLPLHHYRFKAVHAMSVWLVTTISIAKIDPKNSAPELLKVTGTQSVSYGPDGGLTCTYGVTAYPAPH